MTSKKPRNIFAGLVPAVDDPVFHYTDAAGLLGIVQGRELWATEASGMNDVAEVEQGWDFIHDWALAQDDDTVVSAFRKVAAGGAFSRSREGMYVCSASLDGDDANQWRLYGGRARGYAIELNAGVRLVPVTDGGSPPKPSPGSTTPYLVSILDAEARANPWRHVLYADQEKAKVLTDLADRLREYHADQLARRGVVEPAFTADVMLVGRARVELARLAALMKSPGFSGEREVRIVVSGGTKNTSRFRATPQGVVRYARLVAIPPEETTQTTAYLDDLSVTGRLPIPIRSVRLGPLVRAANNRSTIRALLDGYPGDPKVTESKVPLGG